MMFFSSFTYIHRHAIAISVEYLSFYLEFGTLTYGVIII